MALIREAALNRSFTVKQFRFLGNLLPSNTKKMLPTNKEIYFSISKNPWQHGEAIIIITFPQFIRNLDIRVFQLFVLEHETQLDNGD